MPPDAAAAVAEVVAAAAPALPGVRWVPPQGYHLTVCFLGSRRPDEWPAIAAALAPAVSSAAAPLRLRLGGAGVFPDRGRPRVLWLGLAEGERALRPLAEATRGAAQRAGLAVDDRPWRAHCTVARVPAGPSLDATSWRTAAPSTVGSAWCSEALHLLASRAGRAGDYEVVASLPLGLSRRPPRAPGSALGDGDRPL